MRPIILALALLLTTADCAAIFAALPTIIAATQSVAQVVDAIESFVASRNEDAPVVAKAIKRVRDALTAVTRAANAASDIHDGNLQAALAEAQAAYQALVDLTSKSGVHPNPDTGKLAAVGPNQLDVPTALQVRAQLEGK